MIYKIKAINNSIDNEQSTDAYKVRDIAEILERMLKVRPVNVDHAEDVLRSLIPLSDIWTYTSYLSNHPTDIPFYVTITAEATKTVPEESEHFAGIYFLEMRWEPTDGTFIPISIDFTETNL